MNISDLVQAMRVADTEKEADRLQDEIDRRLELIKQFGGTTAGHIHEVLDTGTHTAYRPHRERT